MVQEHQPDIIIGCESQIDQSYNSSEVFPKGYHVFHKDRCEGGGGVFTCVNDKFSASEVPSLDTDAELVWVKITLAKDDPIFICSYYRPPNSMQHSLIQLQESLNK